MTTFASEYGDGLYSLARDEHMAAEILEQAQALCECFSAQPGFLKLLDIRTLPLNERVRIIKRTLDGRAHEYLQNFLMLLCQRGGVMEFEACIKRYRADYYNDNNIAEAVATVARPLTQEQKARLIEKLKRDTGKDIVLIERVDKHMLGGIRVDVDGRRVDNTIKNRMELLRRSLRADS